jgi:hypothetical protein
MVFGDGSFDNSKVDQMVPASRANRMLQETIRAALIRQRRRTSP